MLLDVAKREQICRFRAPANAGFSVKIIPSKLLFSSSTTSRVRISARGATTAPIVHPGHWFPVAMSALLADGGKLFL